jgi:malonyl-CoA O-methyltransferase
MRLAGIERRLLHALARALPTLVAADFLSREVENRMLARLDILRFMPETVLDIGCGAGHSLSCLTARYPDAHCWGADLAASILAPLYGADNKRRILAAHAERLPFASGSVNMVWSNLLLPWLKTPARFFQEAWRVLKPGGLFMFSALGQGTLAEIDSAFADGRSHTQQLFTLDELGNALWATDFADAVMDREDLTVTYPAAAALFTELRAAGARRVLPQHARGLSGRHLKTRLAAHFETLTATRADGRLPVGFVILQGLAWKPDNPRAARPPVDWQPMSLQVTAKGLAT